MKKGRIILAIFFTASIALAFFLIITAGPNEFRPEVRSIAVKPNESEAILRLLFLGDLDFGESYIRTSRRGRNNNVLRDKGYDYCLEKLKPLLIRSHFIVANLETTLSDLTDSPLAGKKSYIHRGHPGLVPETLHSHFIRTVSLANNHSLDYGLEGLGQTVTNLERGGLEWFGAGHNEAEAAESFLQDFPISGHTFHLAVAAGFEYRKAYDEIYAFYAGEKKGGVNLWNEASAGEQIQTLRQSDPNRFIVAFPHWGQNYQWKTKQQTRLARAIIDAGADIVIGHGAHMMQEVEFYRGKWIIYSLGNFLFNSPGRYHQKNVDPFSLIAEVDILEADGDLTATLKLYPIFSDNLATNYQPRLLKAEEPAEVWRLLVRHGPDPGHLKQKLALGQDEIGPFLSLGRIDLSEARN